jgi:hypothetical protein
VSNGDDAPSLSVVFKVYEIIAVKDTDAGHVDLPMTFAPGRSTAGGRPGDTAGYESQRLYKPSTDIVAQSAFTLQAAHPNYDLAR